MRLQPGYAGMLPECNDLFPGVESRRRAESRRVTAFYANNVLQDLLMPNGSIVTSWGSLAALPVYGLTVLFLASRTLIATE